MISVPYHPGHSKNSESRPDGSDPCLICGKPIKYDKQRYTVHVHDGGASIVTEEEAATMDEAADLGCHPIGTDCLRQHPEIKPYVYDRKQRTPTKVDFALYADLYRQCFGENCTDVEIVEDLAKRSELLK